MADAAGFHEHLARAEPPPGGSDRGFGLVFAAVFCLVGLWPLLGGGPVRAWALAASAVFGALGWLRPALLAAPNRAWMRLAMAMQRVVTPVVLGLVFFAVLTPVAVLMRLAGKRPLRLRADPAAESYWEPPPAGATDFRRQF